MNREKQQGYKAIQVICGILFAVFSFLYIFLFQSGLLALMQNHLSHGQTTNNPLLTAIIITVLLMVVQFGVNRAAKLHGRWEALSYIPSCTLLALITDIDVATMSYSPMHWLWTILIAAVLLIGVVWLNRMVNMGKHYRFFGLLWPNMVVFFLMFVMTALRSNSGVAPHMELSAWRYLHDDRYEEILEIGQFSDDFNAEFIALRNLAIVKTGKVGSHLFRYPQPFGADGMMLNRYTKQAEAYSADEYYRHLGEQPYGGESGLDFAERLCQKNDTLYRDMYAGALLLEKKLDDFVKLTAELRDSETMAPVYYQEAWMLYNALHQDAPLEFVQDSELVELFEGYQKMKDKYSRTHRIAKNSLKAVYGRSYWYYYDYITPHK